MSLTPGLFRPNWWAGVSVVLGLMAMLVALVWTHSGSWPVLIPGVGPVTIVIACFYLLTLLTVTGLIGLTLQLSSLAPWALLVGALSLDFLTAANLSTILWGLSPSQVGSPSA
jgi:hypothetical protein